MEQEEAPKSSKKTRNSNSKHIIRKRAPQKPNLGPNAVFVNTKSSLKALLVKSKKLLDQPETKEIVLYCLGAAIQRGILLGLELCKENADLQMHPTTHTTELIDDLEPAVDEEDYKIQRRFNSALQIRLVKGVLKLD